MCGALHAQEEVVLSIARALASMAMLPALGRIFRETQDAGAGCTRCSVRDDKGPVICGIVTAFPLMEMLPASDRIAPDCGQERLRDYLGAWESPRAEFARLVLSRPNDYEPMPREVAYSGAQAGFIRRCHLALAFMPVRPCTFC